VTDVTRLQDLAPGLQVGRSGSDARPEHPRHQHGGHRANSDPRIAFYVDDVYQSRTSQALAAFVDLERVEVQRGRRARSTAQLVRREHRALLRDAQGRSSAPARRLLYGRFKPHRAEGFVNVPLSPAIAVRVAGMYEQQTGT
jgi:iron complex outermembrane receptor protein